MANELIEQIELELTLLDRLFDIYQELLQRAEHDEQLSLVEITALASVVHSFYTGLENIFTNIALAVDQTTPSGERWHRTLLEQMGLPSPKRQAVLTPTTTQSLREYVAFRHFYRHGYSFLLDWNKLKRLVKPMAALWIDIKAELQTFIDGLKQ